MTANLDIDTLREAVQAKEIDTVLVCMPLYAKVELREMTKSSPKRESSVVMFSAIALAK